MTPIVRWWLRLITSVVLITLIVAMTCATAGIVPAVALIFGFWLGTVFSERSARMARDYARESR